MTARLTHLSGHVAGTVRLVGFKKSEPPLLLLCEIGPRNHEVLYHFRLHAATMSGMLLDYREVPPVYVHQSELG